MDAHDDDAMLARFNRIMSASRTTGAVPSADGRRAVPVLAPDSTGRAQSPRGHFPSVPSSASGLVPSSSVCELVNSEAEHAWCRICHNTARVWCADCGDEAYCAKCWREVHVGVAGGLRADAGLRLHATVPCRGLQLAAEMPAVPSGTAAWADDTKSVPIPTAAPATLRCQTCDKAAYTLCLDCDSYYCAPCWRSIHVFPNSDIARHRKSSVR